jgi:serine phosphatase RsbU (regulator of sigma subunit)/PAS domain-containing protein
MPVPDREASGGEVAGLRSRAAALRQAARLPEPDQQLLLEAALTELDSAVAALAESAGSPETGGSGRGLSGLQSERRLLHAVFTATPMPLYLVDPDATVLRANSAACEVLGVGPGYATGKSLSLLIEPSARAALQTQLAAVARTGTTATMICGLLTTSGVLRRELVIGPVTVRGDTDRLLVAIAPAGSASPGTAAASTKAASTKAASTETASTDADVLAANRRLDLLGQAARLLLEGASVSESVLLQRCARLLSKNLATWVVIDVNRRDQLRRHYVAGPEDPESSGLVHALNTTDPEPGSAPAQVQNSRQLLLLTHVEDETLLGCAPDGTPFLSLLAATSLVCIPVTHGSQCYGVLTLIRRAREGQFGLGEAALAQEVGELLGLAISGRRNLRQSQSTEAADTLRATLLPPVLKPIPGVEAAPAHLAPSRGPEVGGDFYDVYPTPGGWGVAIGAVRGKGEDAAAATAAARHAIRVLAHSTADPAQVLRGANEIMLAEDFGGRFVTASAAHLSWQDGTLRVLLATAGHPGPVLIRRDGSTRLIPGGGVALGIFPDPEPATLQLDLSDGDVLFCFTDGLTSVRSPQAAPFETELADTLAQLAGSHPADIVSGLSKRVLDFCEGLLQGDVTMLALRAGLAPAT